MNEIWYNVIKSNALEGRKRRMETYTPMIQQYLALKESVPGFLLFFRLGDFYELFFDDAKLAAQELEITLTGRDGGLKERIPMCGVPYHSYQPYVKKLIEKGYKVAICEQVEDPREAKGVVKREIVRLITPGTYFDEEIGHEKENRFIAAVLGDEKNYAIAHCDITTGEISVTQVQSMEICVEEILAINPAELVVDKDWVTPAALVQNRLVLSPLKEWPDVQSYERFTSHLATPLLQQVTAGLLYYLEETQRKSLDHLQPVKQYEREQYLAMDVSARRNLELFETIREKKKRGSLLWLIDGTRTAMGGRLLRQWLEKPLRSIPEITRRQEVVHFFLHHFFEREELRGYLSQMYDLERLLGRVAVGMVNGREMVHLRESLKLIPVIKQMLSTQEDPIIQEIAQSVSEIPELVERLDVALVDEPPISLKEGGLIRRGYHEELDKLHDARTNGKTWIAQLEAEERTRTGIKNLKVGFNKVFGYYIEITKGNLKHLEEGRYERKQTLTNSERFITPELKEKEALILGAEEKIIDLEYELFIKLRDQVKEYVELIQSIAHQIAALDVLQGLAQIAEGEGWIRPHIVDDGALIIEQGRHPVVEAVVGKGQFIANDTFLDQEQSTLLITGPNMAGKSTYMRQVALIVILAQMGSYVPAAEATIPLVDQLFTRIGAADDLVAGQSTFMVEMAEIKSTTAATGRSLVLIDEIGRGTSTADGMAIAQAVVEYFHQLGCKTLISTHYHELAALEQHLPHLRNVHMAVEERQDEVIFLRKLVPGATNESYGIYCAEIAKLPISIVARARELLQHYRETHPVAVPQVMTIQEQVERTKPLEPRETQLGQKEREVLKQLAQLELITTTPLDALQWLYRLQQMMKDGE